MTTLFDPIFYKNAYPDLRNLSKPAIYQHFIQNAQNQRRLPSREFFYKLYPDFDWLSYIKYNPGLKLPLLEDKAIVEYFTTGYKTDREYRRHPIYGNLLVVAGKSKRSLHASQLLERVRSVLSASLLDSVYIENLNKIDLTPYTHILLDFTALNPALSGTPLQRIANTLRSTGLPIILLGHDLHWWSFDTSRSLGGGHPSPEHLLSMNDWFKVNVRFLKEIHVTHFISLYNCQELRNYYQNTPFIKNYFILPHGYFKDTFHPLPTRRILYDVCCYGATTPYIYPLRNKIANYLNTDFTGRGKVIPNNVDHKLAPVKEHSLNDVINASWLTVATHSIFNYLLRKYMEIGASSSTLICNSDRDIIKHIGHNYVYLNDHYSTDHIGSTIQYYLNNKEILCYLSHKCNLRVKNLDYGHYRDGIQSIYKDIVSGTESENSMELKNHNASLPSLTNYLYSKHEMDINSRNIIDAVGTSTKLLNQYPLIRAESLQGKSTYYYYLENNKSIAGTGIEHLYHIKKSKIIDQIKMCDTLDYFKTFFKNSNLYEFNDPTRASFYYGVWNEDDIEIIRRSTGMKVVIFTGGDILALSANKSPTMSEYLPTGERNPLWEWEGPWIPGCGQYVPPPGYGEDPTLLHDLLAIPNVYIIAISKSISDTLSKHNVKHIYQPFYGDIDNFTVSDPNTNTTRNNILMYGSSNPHTYNYNLVSLLEKKLPQYNFMWTTSKPNLDVAMARDKELKKLHRTGDVSEDPIVDTYGEDLYREMISKLKVYDKEQLENIIERSFIYLRPTPHDGLGSLAIEAGLSGVKTLNNSIGTKNCINFDANIKFTKQENGSFEVTNPEGIAAVNNIIDIINREYKNQNSRNSSAYRSAVIQDTKEILSTDVRLYTEDFYKHNINYYFDKIYVLNLKGSETNRRRIKKLFSKHGINNYKFFTAVNGLEEPYLSEWNEYSKIPFTAAEKNLGRKMVGSPGVLGNLESVKRILQDAKKNKYKRIVFLEDDILLHKDFNNRLTDTISSLDSDWKLLYLGIQNIISKNTKIYNNMYTPNINSSGGFAFAVVEDIYDELIDQCNKKDLPFDCGPLQYIRQKYKEKCKCIYPNICIANVDTSTIRTDVVRTTKSVAKQWRWNLPDYDE